MGHRLLNLAALLAVLFLVLAPLMGTRPAGAEVALQGQWTTFANGDEVRALAMQGNLVWAATHNGGAVRWDPYDGSYTQYLAPQTGIAGNDVRAVTSNGYDFVWFATNKGVSQLEDVEPRHWTTYTTADGLPSDNATAIAWGPDNRLWVGTSQYWDGNNWTGGGLVVRDYDDTWLIYTVDNGLPSNNITDIAFQGSRVWVATRPYKVYQEPTQASEGGWFDEGGGVALLENGTWKVYTKEDSGLPNNRVSAVAVGSDGRVWFATPAGLAVFDGENWQTYTREDGLTETAVRDVSVDNQGRVWAVTYKTESRVGALNLLDGGVWQAFTVEDGLSSRVLRAVLADDQGRIWVGTEPWCRDKTGCEGGGLTEYRPADNLWRVYRTWEKSNLASNQITALALASDGALWVGTRGSGVSVYRNGTWTSYTRENSELASNLVRAIDVAPDGSVWIGTLEYVEDGQYAGGGINRFANGQWEALYDTDNSSLVRNAISTLRIDQDGRVWIGMGDLGDRSGAGLARFDPAVDHWELYDVDDGLPSNLPTDIAFDVIGDRVWIVTAPYLHGGPTGGGVAVFENDQFTSYTAENSEIPTWSGSDVTGDFRAVAVDADGTPWVGTYTTPYNLIQVWPYVDATIDHLEDGQWISDLFLDQGYVSALAFDPDGRLWAGISQDGMGDEPSRGGVRVLFGSTWAAATTMTSDLAGNDVQALAISSSDGDVWIGTYDAGISLLENAYAGQGPTDTPSATDTPGPTETPGPEPTITQTPVPVTPTPGGGGPPPEIPEATTLILVATGLAGLGGYAAYRLRSRRNSESARG